MTDSDVEAELYTAILSDPADNTVRLAYADWADRVGQEARAQCIRFQIEAATTPCAWADVGGPSCISWNVNFKGRCSTCSRATALKAQADELIARHIKEWFPVLQSGRIKAYIYAYGVLSFEDAYGRALGIEFVRGFPGRLRCAWEVFTDVPCSRCLGEKRINQHWDPSSDTMRGGTHCPECPDETPGVFPGAFRAFAWRPGWKARCRECGGTGKRWQGEQRGRVLCPPCRGTGEAPAPRPSFAVPLEAIEFTTMPCYSADWRNERLSLAGVDRWHSWHGAVGSFVPDTAKLLLEAEWPGIAFTLPQRNSEEPT